MEGGEMRAYGVELREHIVAAVDAGQAQRRVAELFGVDRTTVRRYVALARADALAPKPIPGRPRQIGPADERELLLQLRLHPDATLAEHCQRWSTVHGVTPSESTMSRAIRRLGWTRKKGRWQPVSAITTHE
jgi:transposase